MSYAPNYGYGPAQSGRPINLRVIAALIMVVVGVVSYFFETQVNPVTGEKQRVAMNVDQEMSLGLQSVPTMVAEMGGASDPSSDPRARFVSEVGHRIVARSDARRSPYVGNYHFILLNDPDTINAFALPGGQVFITRGLFDKLDDEAELAGVLGHEIGHVVNRHSAEHMASGRLGQLLAAAVGVGASGGEDGGRNAAMIASMVNQMTQLKFSRADESEADRYGLRYMAQAGYDPSAMLDVMEILKGASRGGRQPEMLATHPLPDTRLAEIRATLAEDYPNGIRSDLTRGRPLRSTRG